MVVERNSYDAEAVELMLQGVVNFVRSLKRLDLDEEQLLFQVLDGTIKGMVPTYNQGVERRIRPQLEDICTTLRSLLEKQHRQGSPPVSDNP